ncbi:MAG TPA: hypothetical protein VFX60_14895 [Micromonospora sp.]|nr:hypothetical protein [Micromonospora sp.]
MGTVVETYADLARRILARPPRLGRTRIVAVDGPSGAGKTFFAARLAAALAAPVVRTDDLLDGWADQFTFWPRLQEWVLDPLRAGEPGRYRRYDWVHGRFDPCWAVVPPAPVVLLEGASSARADVRPELAFAVFVTAPAALRRARVLTRDGQELLPYLERWWRREQTHFAEDATREQVDLVVDGASEDSPGATASYVRLR